MNEEIEFKKKSKTGNRISIVEEYENFLAIHSVELKFMVPWSQHDESRPKEMGLNTDKNKIKANNANSDLSVLYLSDIELNENIKGIEKE